MSTIIYGAVKRTWGLFDNYCLSRVTGRPSTAGFWYLPEPARIRDTTSLNSYLQAGGSPPYVMNYAAKLDYTYANEQNIIVLPYSNSIGDQINPEAAFQYALALHDQALLAADADAHHEFLRYAQFFADRQTDEGKWTYDFDWFESKAPWCSALAQSRGASVMLRAGLLTSDKIMTERARLAVSQFATLVEDGGFKAWFAPSQCFYFEEYPTQLNATLNGFMASLFGLFEVAHWLRDEKAEALFHEGIVSLGKMLSHFSVGWWTLYDHVPTLGRNHHSPRYHRLCVDYLNVLALLSNDPIIKRSHAEWRAMDTPLHCTAAYFLKAVRKIIHR